MAIKNFEEFWPFYVGEHRLKATRTFHFVGTTAVFGLIPAAIVLKQPLLVAIAPVAGYGPAWVSHFFIEGNKPASFKYPLWSMQADFIMWGKILTGKMDAEVERCVTQA